MKIIRSGVLGFCMGVRRAIELAVSEAERPGSVYTLGPLIHNPVVLADLESRGVRVLPGADGNELPKTIEGSVIVRAHGIKPNLEKKLRDALTGERSTSAVSRGSHFIDATCPNVKKSQLKAKELALAGYGIFLAGSASHAEIEGIVGYAQEAKAQYCAIVENPTEAKEAAQKLFKTNNEAKTALLGQTTITENEYYIIGEALKEYFPNIEIINTICNATMERQQALRELLNNVDAVIIIGGKESANTRRLLAIAEESGKQSTLVENSSEIPPSFRSYVTVGLCAGASTPDFLIDEIEKELLSAN